MDAIVYTAPAEKDPAATLDRVEVFPALSAATTQSVCAPSAGRVELPLQLLGRPAAAVQTAEVPLTGGAAPFVRFQAAISELWSLAALSTK
jgi:hypothetical protein